MTVADRRDTTEARGPIASEFTALLTTARGRGSPWSLISTTLPVAALDPIDLFAAARSLDLEAALWLQPVTDRSIVGVGRAWAVEAGGPERFAAATAAWRAVLAGAIGSGAPTGIPESGPMLLGGLGFTGRTPEADDPWAPFGPASLVLPSFTLVRSGARTCLTVAVGPDQIDGLAPGHVERRWDALARHAESRREVSMHGESGALDAPPGPGALWVIDERPDRAAWDRTVGLFAGAVGRGRIDKVVLARRVVFRAAADLEVVAALRHLARTAAESTTFAFVRHGTTFLGATPERLVRTVGRSFETDAIAGSAARGQDPAEDARFATALLASEKDREEHAVVVDMLRTSLTPIVEALHVADTPAILPLRHLQHLVTPISGRLRDEAGLLGLAQRLHPTPAVGGAPRDVALALIAEHEGFDRGWYAGPIGWLGADGDGELMVALRCGLVTGTQATLFAGCGIVADSDPTREWEESRLKLRTMTAALGGIAEEDR
ncbi:MAG: isochorismate synthase [Candidatus Limnocylindrales bacterium]|nr:isochorismate synthase [Candidatus Limnocylindrales bacterium]